MQLASIMICPFCCISHTKCLKEAGEAREMICVENLKALLTNLHCAITIDGRISCALEGINALSRKFNRKFFMKGIFREIMSFMKSCSSCCVNISLPSPHLRPPKPTCSNHPQQRKQYDLVDLALRKRTYVADNQRSFRYILTIKCCFRKFCWLFLLQSKSATMVYKLIKFCFDVEGALDILQSGIGKEFVNKLITQFSKGY